MAILIVVHRVPLLLTMIVNTCISECAKIVVSIFFTNDYNITETTMYVNNHNI